MHENAVIGTWGILTNGEEWQVIKKDEEFLSPAVFTEPLGEQRFATSIVEVVKLLEPVLSLDQAIPRAQKSTRSWLQEIQDTSSPRTLIDKLIGPADHSITSPVGLVAWRKSDLMSTSDNLFPCYTAFACAKFDYPDGTIALSDIRDEVYQWIDDDIDRVLGVAFTDKVPGQERQCRAFLLTRKEILVTAQVNPSLPGPRVASQFETLAKNYIAEPPDTIKSALSAVPLRQKFHEEIRDWFVENTSGERNDLRHLIRIMFAWLLQSRGVLRDDTL